MIEMSSTEGKKRQQNLRELFTNSTVSDSTSLNTETGAVSKRTRKETRNQKTTGANSTETGENRNAATGSTESSSGWLANVMKRLTVANSIEDIKSVCCDLVAKVEELANKSSTLQNSSEHTIAETETIKDDMNKLTRHYDGEIYDLKNECISNDEYVTKDDFEKMKGKVDDLEGRSRRNNIRICNIAEGAEGGFAEPSMEKFATMVIRQSMGIQLPEGAIQRAHRVGPKQPGRKRDIIAYFLKYSDKEIVRKAAPKMKPKYNNYSIFFNEDFSTMVVEKRKVLAEEMRRRRNEGQRAWLSGDKLFFVEDDFVYEITAFAPFFYLTEPRRRFRARKQTNNQRPAAAAYNASAAYNTSTDYSNTTMSPSPQQGPRFRSPDAIHPLGFSAMSPMSLSSPSPRMFIQMIPQMRAAAPVITLAPDRKSRTPPTPPENASKQHRADTASPASPPLSGTFVGPSSMPNIQTV
jgi:hypothetical protein